MFSFNITLLLFVSFICCCVGDRFYYFAYGSNLTLKRLKVNNPSVEFYNVAVLEDHRLDFNTFSKKWNGCVATIVEDPGKSVTGAIWLLDREDMKKLDKQEGVDKNQYFPKNVTVRTTEGEEVLARTYEQVENPANTCDCDDNLPYDRRPSNTYLETLIFGAVELGLPSDYIGYLVSFPTNGNHATDEIRKLLGYPFGKQV